MRNVKIVLHGGLQPFSRWYVRLFPHGSHTGVIVRIKPCGGGGTMLVALLWLLPLGSAPWFCPVVLPLWGARVRMDIHLMACL